MIKKEKERDRIARLLKNYGFRVQKSVFECRLTRKDKRKLIDDLEALEIKTGSIKIYRLEFSWKPRIIGKGGSQSPDDDTVYFV